MSSIYAIGARAWGLCDRCGFRYKLNTLKTEMVRGVPNKLRVCTTCWDLDHPQNRQGMVLVVDPEALRDPRPDPGLQASRELTGVYEPPVIPVLEEG